MPNYSQIPIHDSSKHLFPSPPYKFPILGRNLMKLLSSIFIFTILSLFLISFSPTSKWLNCRQASPLDPRRQFTDTAAAPPPPNQEATTNTSHILFGIGGSAETWGRRRHYCELWWRPHVTRGFVWLDEQPRDQAGLWPETSPPYKVSANTTRFNYTCSYGSRSAVRIARIVKESFELGLDDVRWFVMGDDDTVFFVENLVSVLKKYDHERMYYIGGISESVEQDMMHSYSMGYGGGGFAISRPLAAALVRVLDRCIDRYSDFYGSDQKIGGCMSEIGVPLTIELGFHQMDIRGSPYGLLSAHPLAPLVSLHHLDYFQPLFQNMNRTASLQKLMKPYKTDPSRVLQHTFCYDLTRNWSVSVSWGYNVQLYPFLLTAHELSTPLQTFFTWSWNRAPFTFNTRAVSLDRCRRPLVFYFDRIEEFEGGRYTSSRYTRFQADYQRKCMSKNYEAAHLVKGFNVSAGLLDPQFWNKGPRRQCCQIVSGAAQRDDVVEVRIRDCNQWETVSPP